MADKIDEYFLYLMAGCGALIVVFLTVAAVLLIGSVIVKIIKDGITSKK